jgi:hypothetical protein
MDINDLVQLMQNRFDGITVLEHYTHCSTRWADSDATPDPSRYNSIIFFSMQRLKSLM